MDETFQVQGMTCDHCVKAVTAEISQMTGVSAVNIDLATGRVTVHSAAPLDRLDLAAAVAEAGYELVS